MFQMHDTQRSMLRLTRLSLSLSFIPTHTKAEALRMRKRLRVILPSGAVLSCSPEQRATTRDTADAFRDALNALFQGPVSEEKPLSILIIDVLIGRSRAVLSTYCFRERRGDVQPSIHLLAQFCLGSGTLNICSSVLARPLQDAL